MTPLQKKELEALALRARVALGALDMAIVRGDLAGADLGAIVIREVTSRIQAVTRRPGTCSDRLHNRSEAANWCHECRTALTG